MANNYKVIDEKIWERKMHCMIFRNIIEPYKAWIDGEI